MSNSSVGSSGMRKRQNCGLKCFTAPSTFTFRFLSSALLLLFFPHSFSFVGHSLGFISGRNVFAKSRMIVKLFWRKYEWVVGFSVECFGESYTVFWRLSLVCCTEWRSFGYGLKDLVLLHKLVAKVVWYLWIWRHKWYKGIDSTWALMCAFRNRWVKR